MLYLEKIITNPNISVVMASYNQDDFIGDAIDSVISQTYSQWELIIIDNNSTDRTNEILNKYDDERLRIYRIDNGGVVAKSRNMGLRLARGEYIAFIDSDDLWCNEKLASLDLNSAGIFSHYLQKVNIRGEPILTKEGLCSVARCKSYGHNEFLLNGNAAPLSSLVVRKDLLIACGGFNESKYLKTIEDYDLVLRITKKSGSSIICNEKILGYYRAHDSNLSSNNFRYLALSILNLKYAIKLLRYKGNKKIAFACMRKFLTFGYVFIIAKIKK